MSSLVNHLVELTRFRDRDQADVLLMETLAGLMHPRRLALHRCVGDGPEARWLTRAHVHGAPAQEGRRPEFEQLPLLDSQPDWRDCLQAQQPVALPGPPPRLLVPLLAGCEGTGVVEMETAQPLSAEDQGTVAAIVGLYGNFLALLDYGQRDALTGLLNRKTFDDCFMHALPGQAHAVGAQDPRASRAVQRHWLAVLDIDHFKGINDRFGHLIGDEVLLLLARLMRTVLRYDDRLFRFGGEEFVLLLAAPQESDVDSVLERLRQQIERFEFPQVGQVTVSIGFSDVRPADIPAAAFDRADRALYHAKTSGRNRVVGPAVLAAQGVAELPMRTGEVDLF
ncbi:GGDEF domain-containing protein [Azohydromonas caseinilytica]|uniref:diguanylate cyclase n=1 Tax=Azohydromonas caseinilytica TaxID=2728836 RepID=A0A848FAB4_9BURK|nr:GGDEF domain-containing protein [Azohydromonas caseinilytica]NML15150.1 GGDEF domain-containing protein [Azohydromonas caseinilytica]